MSFICFFSISALEVLQALFFFNYLLCYERKGFFNHVCRINKKPVYIPLEVLVVGVSARLVVGIRKHPWVT